MRLWKIVLWLTAICCIAASRPLLVDVQLHFSPPTSLQIQRAPVSPYGSLPPVTITRSVEIQRLYRAVQPRFGQNRVVPCATGETAYRLRFFQHDKAVLMVDVNPVCEQVVVRSAQPDQGGATYALDPSFASLFSNATGLPYLQSSS